MFRKFYLSHSQVFNQFLILYDFSLLVYAQIFFNATMFVHNIAIRCQFINCIIINWIIGYQYLSIKRPFSKDLGNNVMELNHINLDVL